MKPPKIRCPFARAKQNDEVRPVVVAALGRAADQVGRGCGKVFKALLSLTVAALTNGKKYALVCGPDSPVSAYRRTVVEICRSSDLQPPIWYEREKRFRFANGGEVLFLTRTPEQVLVCHDEAKSMIEKGDLDG